jgi:putative ABC transport system permease protein
MLALIALRNLSRNRRRTLLSLLVVSSGTAGLLLTAGFVRYSFDGLREAIIRGGLGHLEITPARDLEGNASPAERTGRPPGFSRWREARSVIEGRPRVRAAGAAIQLAGVATNGDRSASFLGVGVEPAREQRMGVEVKLRGGANLPDEDPGEGNGRALLGVGLGRILRAAPGDSIVVMAATPDGSLNALDLTVAGLFSTGFEDLDSRILKMHVATAQRLLGTEDVTSLLVGLEDTRDTREAAVDLKGALAGSAPPLAIVDWETRAPFYGQVRALYAGIFDFLGAVVALLVVLSCSNTLFMSVLERVREFGTLLAIGTSRAGLAGLLALEAAWLGLLGALLGSVLGLGLVALVNALEIKMAPPPAAVDPLTLALRVAPSDFLWAMAFMIVIVVVAALPPTLRILRLRIVDALGHV